MHWILHTSMHWILQCTRYFHALDNFISTKSNIAFMILWLYWTHARNQNFIRKKRKSESIHLNFIRKNCQIYKIIFWFRIEIANPMFDALVVHWIFRIWIFSTSECYSSYETDTLSLTNYSCQRFFVWLSYRVFDKCVTHLHSMKTDSARLARSVIPETESDNFHPYLVDQEPPGTSFSFAGLAELGYFFLSQMQSDHQIVRATSALGSWPSGSYCLVGIENCVSHTPPGQTLLQPFDKNWNVQASVDLVYLADPPIPLIDARLHFLSCPLLPSGCKHLLPSSNLSFSQQFGYGNSLKFKKVRTGNCSSCIINSNSVKFLQLEQYPLYQTAVQWLL